MAPLPPGARPATLAEGVAGQLALAQLTDQAAPGGFKIGATTQQMQRILGLEGPAAGFMPRDNLHASGSTLGFDRFLRPGVECELAVHLAHDLPPGPCSPEEAAAAVDLLMAAIEIVENRYADLAAFGTPALVADQVFHAGAVLGQPLADWRELDLQAVTGELSLDGKVAGSGKGADLLGGPMQALAWLAGSAEAAAFGGLRAGQIVMLGSVTQPFWLDGPAEIEVRFGPLQAVKFTLT
jgi:2-keto-4-pentenoate hydratase